MAFTAPAVDSEEAALRARAAKVFPSGDGFVFGHQSISNLPKSFPQFWKSGKGSRLISADGKHEVVDFMCAYGPNILGYRNEVVDRAATQQQIEFGDTFTGPTPRIIELAELLTSTIRGASWAMFAKNGNDATTTACAIARAQTRRPFVLVQATPSSSGLAKGPRAYHGASPNWQVPGMPGILDEDTANQAAYVFNDLGSVEDAVRKCECLGGVAAIMVSAFDYCYSKDLKMPTNEFAVGVRKICDHVGALLILDDVRAGFRLHLEGTWAGLFGVVPDISCYCKALGNGYGISAITGGEAARKGAKRIFATGSYWFAAAPMAAAIATIKELHRINGPAIMAAAGEKLCNGLYKISEQYGIKCTISGPPAMFFLSFEDDLEFERKRGMLFCEIALRNGALFHPHHNMFLSCAHSNDDIEIALKAAEEGFKAVASAFPKSRSKI